MSWEQEISAALQEVENVPAIRFDIEQFLTDQQKAVALANIDYLKIEKLSGNNYRLIIR